jgi:hypothetical protein
MAPAWYTVMLSVLAAGSCSAGSRRGITALRAGWLIARNAVCTANSASTSQTPPTPLAAVTHSASDDSAMPDPLNSSSVRRSTASAIAPPHSPKTTSGTSPNRPVNPT